MIKINKDNFKKIMELALMYEDSVRYNKECFSSADIRREAQASDNIDKILALAIKEGIDIEKELDELTKERNITFSNGSNFQKQDKDYCIRYKLSSFENFVEKHNPELIVNGEPIITNNKFCKSLEIDSTRFCYEFWEVSREANLYLEDYCGVFKSALKIIDMSCNYYTKKSVIKAIHCIRDTVFCDEINASKYVVFIENDNNDRLAIIIQLDSKVKDSILFNCRSGKCRYIIPLDGANRWDCREYDENLNEKAIDFISKIESFENTILNE